MDQDLTTIASWIQPEAFCLDVDIRDRAEALAFMAAAIGRAHGLDPVSVGRALERREQATSTALGDGFAIPHARIPGLLRPLTLFMRTRSGIAFDAPDGRPVHALLAIMVPADGDKEDHLQLLGLIARMFSDRPWRARLKAAADDVSAAACFRDGIAASLHLAENELARTSR